MSAKWLAIAFVCLLAALGGSAAFAAEPSTTIESPPVVGSPPDEETVYTPIPNPDPERSILVLNVGWGGVGPSYNWAPVDQTLLATAVANLSGPVNAWFRGAAPQGAFRDWLVHSGGSFWISGPTLTSGKELSRCVRSEAPDFARSLTAHAGKEASRVGYDLSRFRYVVYAYSGEFCGADGLVSGNGIVIGNRAEPYTLVHELGHQLGLGHAETLECLDDAGVKPVPLNDDHCTTEEYADTTDVMGRSFIGGGFNAPHAFRLGWLRNQFYDLVDGVYTRTVQLRPFGAAPAEGSMRAVRLRDGGQTLWLEYRQRVGVDMGMEPGLYVHREKPTNPAASQLLDMSPGQWGDENMAVGQTWINTLGAMQVTLNSATPSGATVTIARTPKAVTVPDLRGLTAASIRSYLDPVNLVYGGQSGTVEDRTCTLINRVASQSPSAGSKAIEGSSVTVKMGVRPRTPCL
ncbi:MAG TPA: PASTA domain-containing protein [Solirubrobacterales bacterium]|nr:PASTA domain-containing protein [Solirubrobacterales bacterium]